MTCCVTDTCAHLLLSNMLRFDGYCSCTWCLHPGKCIDRQVKYTMDVDDYAMQTHEGMLEDMSTALESGNTINGVKGPSIMVNIPYFNLVDGYVPDYMHCSCLGVSHMLTEMWFSNVGEGNYIGEPTTIDVIDQQLKAFVFRMSFTKNHANFQKEEIGRH